MPLHPWHIKKRNLPIAVSKETIELHLEHLFAGIVTAGNHLYIIA